MDTKNNSNIRIYISGTLLKPIAVFIPKGIYFANKNKENADNPAKDCILFKGISIKSSVEGNDFFCRWTGVSMANDDEYENIETEQLLDALSRLVNTRMKLVDIDADAYDDVSIKVLKLSFCYDLNGVCHEVTLDDRFISEIMDVKGDKGDRGKAWKAWADERLIH